MAWALWRDGRRHECHLDTRSKPPRVQQLACQGDGVHERSRQMEEGGQLVRSRTKLGEDE